MTSRIPFKLVFALTWLISLDIYAQTAPAHLKYFGFTAIDCLYDDPLDASTTTNYIAEVDTFSNLAHMCVYDYTENLVTRINLMNAHCVNPLLHIQNIFFQAVDTLAPSGVNYDLYPDFTARWASFITTNTAALSTEKIGCFYIADEPYWNGISLADMDTVCALLKNAFPSIPLMMVEAYNTVNSMEVPQAMDWVGFDRYGTFDPQTEPEFVENLDTVKARLSGTNQKIVLIVDDQWFPEYQTYLGWSQDTMADVVQNYYDLAAADTSIIGLFGYIWPGGLDGATHHGVRNMTSAVINKNVEIGQMIKANYSPCGTTDMKHNNQEQRNMNIFPNPARNIVNVALPFGVHNAEIKIYNTLGQTEQTITNINNARIQIETLGFPNGLHFIVLQNGNQQLNSKFIINNQ
ncbi:MAG: T9SS type A sorting domain-containing protein [Bacteroidia bacterium]